MRPEDHRHIAALEELYGPNVEFDRGWDIVLCLDWQDITDSDVVYPAVRDMQDTLRARTFTEASISAARDVTFELASNVLLHAKSPRRSEDLLVVATRNETVSIWMFGYGPKQDVDRMKAAIDKIYKIASPPRHKDALLERRNNELLRKVGNPDSRKHGGGFGLLTVAALSKDRLQFLKRDLKTEYSFLLRSTI